MKSFFQTESFINSHCMVETILDGHMYRLVVSVFYVWIYNSHYRTEQSIGMILYKDQQQAPNTGNAQIAAAEKRNFLKLVPSYKPSM